MTSTHETLESIARDLFIVRCTSVATLAVLVYDYLLTLDDEIRLVWQSRISLVKCIYFMNRILAFAAATCGAYLFLFNSNGDACYELVFAASITNVFIFLCGEIILFTRVYAIWGGGCLMAAALTAFYLAGAVGALYVSIHVTSSAFTFEVFVPELFGNGCLVGFTSSGFWLCYLSLLIHEIAMLAMIIIRSIALNRQIISQTVNMLIKDGVLYFICVLTLTILNMLLLFYGPPQLRGFLIISQGVLHSILCARLLLRLRGAYHSLTTRQIDSIPLQLDTTEPSAALTTEPSQRAASTGFSSSNRVLQRDVEAM